MLVLGCMIVIIFLLEEAEWANLLLEQPIRRDVLHLEREVEARGVLEHPKKRRVEGKIDVDQIVSSR